MKARPGTSLTLRLRTLLLSLLCWSGCAGERGLADRTYPGEPLATLEGNLRVSVQPSGAQTRMALGWVTDLAALKSVLELMKAQNPCAGRQLRAVRYESSSFEA